MNAKRGLSGVFLQAAVVAVLWGCVISGAHGASAVIAMGTAEVNAGDVAEVDVRLTAEGEAPSTVALFIKYNPAFVTPEEEEYEFVLRDLSGTVLTDNEGQPLTQRSAVRLNEVLSGASVSVAVHEADGVLAVIVANGQTPMVSNGVLLTVAFRVDQVTPENTSIPLLISPADAQEINGSPYGPASASLASAEEVQLTLQNGQIDVGCIPAETPAGVQASQDRADGVYVTWDAVTTANAEYRVYRSVSADFSQALPLGDSWQVSTSFLDVSAAQPTQVQRAGCFREAQYEYVSYYYWVKARTATGCESTPSADAALGQRGASKVAGFGERTVAETFPLSTFGQGMPTVAKGAAVALRLQSESVISEASIWGEIVDEASSDYEIHWVAQEGADGKSGWVVFTPATTWLDAEMTVRAGADGAETVVRQFTVENAEKTALNTCVDDLLPELTVGVGAVQHVYPDQPLVQPQWIWLPVPEAIDPAAVVPYCYLNGRWYPAPSVAGWLVGKPQIRRQGNLFLIGCCVRHGGVVQLGYSPLQWPPKKSEISMASTCVGNKQGYADILLGVILALAFLAPIQRVFRTS